MQQNTTKIIWEQPSTATDFQNEFGYSVSIDDSRAAIGSRIGNGGYVYTFEYDQTSNTWAQTSAISKPEKSHWIQSDGTKIEGGHVGIKFGHAVDIDGTRMVVGAPDDDEGVLFGRQSGSVHIYDLNANGDWSHTIMLTASNPTERAQFGWSVSLQNDRCVVGSPGMDHNGLFSNPGGVHVFDYDGTNWIETAVLTASDATNFDRFGWSVSLDGDRIAIGADNDDTNNGNGGSVYIYDLVGNQWTETCELLPSDGEENDFFGHSVSLDGDRLAVSSYVDDVLTDEGGLISDTGTVYIFQLTGAALDSWGEITKLNELDARQFGKSLSLKNNRLLVGAPATKTAYLYDLTSSTDWTQTAVLTGEGSGQVGFSVDLDDFQLLVGSPGANSNGETYITGLPKSGARAIGDPHVMTFSGLKYTL